MMSTVSFRNSKFRSAPLSKIVLCCSLAAGLVLPFKGPSSADEKEKDVFFSLTRTPIEREKLPTNTSIIDAQQIEKLGLQNAGQLVDLVPSVNTVKTFGLGSTHLPKIRGFLNKQIVVYIDNRRVPRDVTGNVDLSQIPAEAIDKIEVVRGAGSVLYGPDAEGGVIHIFTKKAKGYIPSVQANAQWGSYGTEIYSASMGTKRERAEGYVTASRNKSDNFQFNNAYDNTSINGNLGYDSGVFGKTMAYFSHAQSQIGLSGGTTLQIHEWDGQRERFPQNQFARQKDDLNSFELEHQVNLFEKVDFTARASNSDIDRDRLTTSTGPVTHRHRVNRKNIYFQADSFFGLTGGVEYYKEDIRSPFSVVPQTNGYGIFLQQKASWRNLTGIAGVRFDNNTEWGDSTSPRFSLIYQAAPWLKLSGNIGHSFQGPTFADMTDFDNNTFEPVARLSTAPALGPENAWHYDVGFEVEPMDNLSAKLTVFRADIRDKIAGANSADGLRFTSMNLQKAFNQGVEAEITHSIGSWLWHTLNYSYLQSEGKGDSFAPHFIELSFVPRNRFNYINVINSPCGVGFTNIVRYVQEQYSAAANATDRQKLPDYGTWDTEIFYKWKSVKLRFGVNNVLERRYVETADSPFSAFGVPATLYPQAGRTYWGGITVTFM